MNQRRWGNTAERVTEIGLGCWQLGGDWGAVTADMAREILRAAHAAGSRFLDTAEVYGNGKSEQLIGAFLQDLPAAERPFVATKIARRHPPAEFRRATEESLARLGLDRLDLTQLHCFPPAALELEATWKALRELRDAGLVRHIGASVETMAEARLCIARGAESVQIIFNVFRQDPIEELFALAQDRGVALIARLPLASGLLTGKFTAATTFGADDHRNYNRDGAAFNVGETFAGLPFATGLKLVDQLRATVPPGLTLAQAALRWVLDHPAVTVAIPGASRPDQATGNAAVSALPSLPAEVHARWRQLYRDAVRPAIRGPQ